MQVSCPKCETDFIVEDALIPDEGRILVCSFCDYEWFYVPGEESNVSARSALNDNSDIKALVSDIQDYDGDIDNIDDSKRGGSFFGSLFKIAAILALIFLAFYQWHKISNREAELKIVRSYISNNNLELEIANGTSTRVKTRAIDISFFNEANRLIRKYKYMPEANSVFPNSSYKATIPIISGVTRVEAKI